MATNKIFVWVKEPGKKPRHVWISNSLKALQTTVGGSIECYPIGDGRIIICNEEGKILDLPYNFRGFGQDFVGTVIFCGVDGEDFVDFPGTNAEMHRMFGGTAE